MTGLIAPLTRSLAALALFALLPLAVRAGPSVSAAAEAPSASGRSLLNELLETDADGALQVPFPFPALLRQIGTHLDPRQPSGGLSVVLIPLGRSLQRHAAGDIEAFRYPRVVAAVTGEPPAAAPPGHRFLRDRLYVAYHEKAAVLEVISYNEHAGRFDFQLVHDYRAGGTPTIIDANRTLCLACHQNAGPIFSRPSWDETSASPPIAARLAATGLSYYGLSWRHGVDIPDAIDAATARANLLATGQRLWRDGCAGGERAAAVACRAEALRLALRYRLGAGPLPALDGAATRRDLVEPLLANWRRRWPDGLPVPDPQLPNRQPFAGIEGGMPTPDDAALARYADVTAAFDPLALRPPLELWPGRDTADVGRFIHILSSFFSHADIALIDRHLAAAAGAPRRELAFTCTRRHAAAGTRLDLDCDGPDGARLLARVALRDNAPAGGWVDRLTLGGNAAMGALELEPLARGADAANNRFVLRRTDGLGVRTPSGEAIRAMRLADAAAGPSASVTLELVADLAPLDEAIDALADASLSSGAASASAALGTVPRDAPADAFPADAFPADAFPADASLEQAALDEAPLGDSPLRRTAVLAPVLAHLGVALPASPMPPVGAQPARARPPVMARAGAWPPALQPFLRQCGQCHADDSTFPPGFLRGDDSRIRASLAGCAERILYRLEMNRRAPGSRAKTPMPPPAAAHAADFTRSPDLPAMRATVVGMLEARGGDPAAVLAAPYAALPPCIAGAAPAQRGDRP